jgi:hypothetical protein
MAGSHWPCCGACGACLIASLTKFRRAKQTGLDTCCSQCLFLSRMVRLFPPALTVCSEVMTDPCWETSSNMRTLTRMAVFSLGRHDCRYGRAPPSLFRLSQYSTDSMQQQATVNTIDHQHQYCQGDPPASPTQQLDHSKLLLVPSAPRHYHRNPARPLTTQVSCNICLSISQLHHSNNSNISQQQWHPKRKPSLPFARPGRLQPTHSGGSDPGFLPTTSRSLLCRQKSPAAAC